MPVTVIPFAVTVPAAAAPISVAVDKDALARGRPVIAAVVIAAIGVMIAPVAIVAMIARPPEADTDGHAGARRRRHPERAPTCEGRTGDKLHDRFHDFTPL